MNQILLTFIGAVLTFMFAVILAKMNRNETKAAEREKQRQALEEQREKERQEREEITLKSLDAIFCVTKELVECTLNGKPPNGELKAAYDYKQKAKHELQDYERKQASRL